MQQLFSIFSFIITGIIIGILFDFFRILRKSFETTNFVIYLQDILFWILTGIITLFSIFQFNYGEIRAYVFLGILFGFIIYMLTISKHIIKYSVIIIKWIKKIIYYPFHAIIIFFNKLLILPIQKLIKVIKETLKNIYKKTNNMTKNNKKIRKKEIKLKEKRGIL